MYITLVVTCTCTCGCIPSGCAAALYGLCITPAEFEARLGEFSHYCPVSLAQNELVDCSHELSLKYSAEFRYMYMYIHGMDKIATLCTYVHDVATCIYFETQLKLSGGKLVNSHIATIIWAYIHVHYTFM